MTQNDYITEQWATCPLVGYEHYQVSDCGRVRNTRTGRVLNGHVNWCGYHNLRLSSRGQTKSFYSHRLVWLAFRGEIPPGLEVDHRDGDNGNNRLDNLQLMTHQENLQKRRKGWKWGDGWKKKHPRSSRVISDETREKLSAGIKAYHEAKKKALEQQ